MPSPKLTSDWRREPYAEAVRVQHYEVPQAVVAVADGDEHWRAQFHGEGPLRVDIVDKDAEVRRWPRRYVAQLSAALKQEPAAPETEHGKVLLFPLHFEAQGLVESHRTVEITDEQFEDELVF